MSDIVYICEYLGLRYKTQDITVSTGAFGFYNIVYSDKLDTWHSDWVRMGLLGNMLDAFHQAKLCKANFRK